jgi:hypothetical protein
VVLGAIQDTTSSISSQALSVLSMEMTAAVSTLLYTAFQTYMHGRLWDDALQSCIANPSDAQRNTYFKHLTLCMVNAGALGKIIDMSSRRYPIPSSINNFANMELGLALGNLSRALAWSNTD